MIYSSPEPSLLSSVQAPDLKHEISEAHLTQWWKNLETGKQISTVDKRTLYILDRGCPNSHDGPDILGASILIDTHLFHGDVEFHINERSWFHHGHHQDPRYDQVILHVVVKVGNRRAVTRLDRPILSVRISPRQVTITPEIKCQLTNVCDEKTILRFLRPLARIRWLRKVLLMRDTIRETDNIQDAFYIQSFRSLGFKGNAQQFECLARNVPLHTFSDIKEQEEVISILLGVSGFLHSPPGQQDNEKMTYYRLWKDLSRQNRIKQFFPVEVWKKKGIRPNAYPERRIGYGSNIITALLKGWHPWDKCLKETFEDIEGVLFETVPKKGWMVEWLGNVVLPFQEAWDEVHQSGGDENRFIQWFHLDLGYSYSQIVRQFGSYFQRKNKTSFGLQQGMLSLLERYCAIDLCQLCPLRR